MNDEVMRILNDQSQAIGRIEGHLQTLVGNGQPGKIARLEDRINSLEGAKNYAVGFGAGLVFLEGAFHYIMHKLGIR
jgi:hypothetical protein